MRLETRHLAMISVWQTNPSIPRKVKVYLLSADGSYLGENWGPDGAQLWLLTIWLAQVTRRLRTHAPPPIPPFRSFLFPSPASAPSSWAVAVTGSFALDAEITWFFNRCPIPFPSIIVTTSSNRAAFLRQFPRLHTPSIKTVAETRLKGASNARIVFEVETFGLLGWCGHFEPNGKSQAFWKWFDFPIFGFSPSSAFTRDCPEPSIQIIWPADPIVGLPHCRYATKRPVTWPAAVRILSFRSRRKVAHEA